MSASFDHRHLCRQVCISPQNRMYNLSQNVNAVERKCTTIFIRETNRRISRQRDSLPVGHSSLSIFYETRNADVTPKRNTSANTAVFYKKDIKQTRKQRWIRFAVTFCTIYAIILYNSCSLVDEKRKDKKEMDTSC